MWFLKSLHGVVLGWLSRDFTDRLDSSQRHRGQGSVIKFRNCNTPYYLDGLHFDQWLLLRIDKDMSSRTTPGEIGACEFLWEQDVLQGTRSMPEGHEPRGSERTILPLCSTALLASMSWRQPSGAPGVEKRRPCPGSK